MRDRSLALGVATRVVERCRHIGWLALQAPPIRNMLQVVVGRTFESS
jgi:hypothetical protein